MIKGIMREAAFLKMQESSMQKLSVNSGDINEVAGASELKIELFYPDGALGLIRRIAGSALSYTSSILNAWTIRVNCFHF